MSAYPRHIERRAGKRNIRQPRPQAGGGVGEARLVDVDPDVRMTLAEGVRQLRSGLLGAVGQVAMEVVQASWNTGTYSQ